MVFLSLLVLFQNCGPATLSGSAEGSSTTPVSNTLLQATEVGALVDLQTLLTSPQENASNVLFPAANVAEIFYYSNNTPVIENIVLLNNNFDSIQWVHGPSSKVVAIGENFNQMSFSADLLGAYYVFGFRQGQPYLICRFSIVPKTGTTLGATSVNAVKLNQKLVASDSVNESVLLSVSAPSVDVSSIKYNLKQKSQILTGRRAILVTKKLSESIDVDTSVSDVTGNTLTLPLNLVAKVAPTPTPTPTPTPAPIITPEPKPSPATSPTPTPANINLATMSSVIYSTPLRADHPVEHLFDNCMLDSTSCTSGTDQSSVMVVEFDFKTLQQISVVKLFGDIVGSWISVSFNIEVKNSPTEAYSLYLSGIDAQMNDFARVVTTGLTARFVKITIYGNPASNAVQARELEIWGRPAN